MSNVIKYEHNLKSHSIKLIRHKIKKRNQSYSYA